MASLPSLSSASKHFSLSLLLASSFSRPIYSLPARFSRVPTSPSRFAGFLLRFSAASCFFRRQGEMDSHESFTDFLIRSGVPMSRNLDESFAEVDETYPNFEDLDTPVETPKAKKTKTKRGPAFTEEEDNLIISAYLNISQDPIIGNGQKASGYWWRVSEYFHQHHSGEGRTQVSLMSRWSSIQLVVNKFCGFYDQVCARNRSGNNEDDKIKETKTMFKEFAGVSFKFEHSWNLLRSCSS